MPSLPSQTSFSQGPGVAMTLAQQAAPAGAPDGLRTLVQMLPIALVLLAAYVLLLTASGIYGTVANVDREGDRVTLKIDDTARITVTLSSIARVVGDRGGDAEAKGTTRDDA
jgi:hypothetical protein